MIKKGWALPALGLLFLLVGPAAADDDPKVEAAVALGLKWLALHQGPDGSWKLDSFNKYSRDKLTDPFEKVFEDKSSGQGVKDDVAGTALGVLPFLAAGHTHKPAKDGKDPEYRRTVQAGLTCLLAQQNKDGSFKGSMYSHGLATLALCESYGLTTDPALKDPAQKALDYIVNAQNPRLGGWRYKPQQDSDTSVTGWQLQALKSGQLAGLTVPEEVFKGAEKWLDRVSSSDQGDYGYVEAPKTTQNDSAVAMTASGLTSRLLLGWTLRNQGLIKGFFRIKLAPPGGPASKYNCYYGYYATFVMNSIGGNYTPTWNDKLREHLLKSQDKNGSWAPTDDPNEKAGGRVMVTSLSLLALEMPKRELLLFRQDAPPPRDK